MRTPIPLTLMLLATMPAPTPDVVGDKGVRFEGRVVDEAGNPIGGADIRVEDTDADSPNGSSTSDGSFAFSLRILSEGASRAKLRITRVGFAEKLIPVALGSDVVSVGDVTLTANQPATDMSTPRRETTAPGSPAALGDPEASLDANVSVAMTAFRSEGFIAGRVTGLDPASYDQVKVVAYVLTDAWYIHPWAENASGRGFALVDSNGDWSLETVWRGHQAYRLALVVMPRAGWAHSKIELRAGDPDAALIAELPGVKAYTVVEAPPGI
jgi:Carboxypeptidase regulatory-like domain